jgi:hypothetical protein
MNERIKELVKQAGGNISMRNLASNPVQHRESVELWDDHIEKFAELVVNECCKQLLKEDIRHGGFGYNQFGLHNKLREYFGVKE